MFQTFNLGKKNPKCSHFWAWIQGRSSWKQSRLWGRGLGNRGLLNVQQLQQGA